MGVAQRVEFFLVSPKQCQPFFFFFLGGGENDKAEQSLGIKSYSQKIIGMFNHFQNA